MIGLMPGITRVNAIANGSVAFIAWDIDAKIPGCVGFDIVRILLDDDGTETGRKSMAAWVPFEGQTNKNWEPQSTSVWPAQRLMWRDLTLLQKRGEIGLNPTEQTVRYVVTPLGLADADDPDKLPQNLPADDGNPVWLKPIGESVSSGTVHVTTRHGSVRCAFTNGVLSTQFLVRNFERDGKKLTPASLKAACTTNSPVRTYLAGQSLTTIKDFFAPGPTFRQALYELADHELIGMITNSADSFDLVLSNTSKDKDGVWDVENAPTREELRENNVRLIDRFFNNDHIGHNKFSVRTDAHGNKAVLTGSTNWTWTGLCAQSNNVIVIESNELADQYINYWQNLREDTAGFQQPEQPGASTNNRQGQRLRAANQAGNPEVTLQDNTVVKVWFSPNTIPATRPKDAPTPPDLAEVFDMMRKAKDLILFAVFMPSQSAKGDIVGMARDIGLASNSLMVYGCASDPTALPNFDPNADKSDVAHRPFVFDQGHVHMVRAAAVGDDHDKVANFEDEMLKSSMMAHAIIHDKIIVVDPLSEDGFVVTGSHNLGTKASYENDENLLIIRKNPSVIQAYATHVLDLYDHYRFRAKQADLARQGKAGFSGFLQKSDGWMDEWLGEERRALSQYFAQ